MKITLAKHSDAQELAQMRWDFQLEKPGEKSQIEHDEFIKLCTHFLQESLESELWNCWIAKDGDVIVAHLFLHRISIVPKPQFPNEKYFGYVTNAYTKPDYRNRGIGGQLLEQLITQARKERLDTLIVWPSEKGVNFYKRAGFSKDNEVLELKIT